MIQNIPSRFNPMPIYYNPTWKGESHVSGDVFPTEDDPYAWYYNK